MSLALYSGLREQSLKRTIFDAGQAWKNINLTALRADDIAGALSDPWTYEGVSVTPTPLGATNGGASFNPGKEGREVEIDGVRVPMKGARRISRYAPTLTVNLLELADVETLSIAWGAVDVTETASAFYEVRPRLDIKNSDYLGNIAILATVSEDNQVKPAIIVVENALVIENTEITFEDDNESTIEAVFAGHSEPPPGDPFKVPFALFLPIPEDGLGS